MNKKEYIDRKAKFEKSARIKDWAYTIVFMGILLANIPLADRIPEDWNLYYLCGFFAFLFGNIYLVVKFNKWLAKSSGLNCISCNQPIVGDNSAIAIATGNCPICGEKAFSDSKA